MSPWRLKSTFPGITLHKRMKSPIPRTGFHAHDGLSDERRSVAAGWGEGVAEYEA